MEAGSTSTAKVMLTNQNGFVWTSHLEKTYDLIMRGPGRMIRPYNIVSGTYVGRILYPRRIFLPPSDVSEPD